MKRFLLVLHTTLVSVCFATGFVHASSSFDVTVNNSSTSPLYYVIATTNLSGKVLDPKAALQSMSTLGPKTSEIVPEPKKIAGIFTNPFAAAPPAPLPDTETTERSKATKRLTQLTQLFAAADKTALENRINGIPLSADAKKLVVVKRFPQDIRSHCSGKLSFTIKNKGVRAATPSEQAITVTRNDKELTCTLFAQEKPADASGTAQQTQEAAGQGAQTFLQNATKLRQREQEAAQKRRKEAGNRRIRRGFLGNLFDE